jgi:hypothetical protein
MGLTTPNEIWTFQRKLYLKAKAEAAQDAVTGHPSVFIGKSIR